jgi:hypothetical protein
MKPANAVLGILAILALGMAIGGVVTYAVGMRRIEGALRSPDGFSQSTARRISRRLRLDGEQRERLTEVVRRSRARIREIREKINPELEAVFRDADNEIYGFLRPAQKERYEAMVRRREKLLGIRRRGEPPAAPSPAAARPEP